MPRSPATAASPPGHRRVSIGLGLLSAIGGLVDVGNLVANPQAGAEYGAKLIPVVVVSGLFVALFAEMAGRVTAVSGLAGFEIVGAVLPRRWAQANLVACVALTMMTCAAELGGIAQIAGFELGASARLLAVPAGDAVGLVVVLVSLRRADTALGFAGLALFVVVAALVACRPSWHTLGSGLFALPQHGLAAYGYVAIAQVGSMIVPYQLLFFSSGTAEEGWRADALHLPRLNAWLGYGIGTLLAAALVAAAAAVFAPRHLSVQRLSQVLTLPRAAGLGAAGDAVMAFGMLVAMSGAALQTALATGYFVAQHRGWSWGMDRSPRHSKGFFALVLASLVLGGIVMTTGVDVVALTDYSLVLSTVVLPLTYWPVWAVARDRGRMAEHASGRVTQLLGAACLVLVAVVAVLAIPALALGS